MTLKNTYPSFYPAIKYIVLAALIYMPVFGFLDTLPIRMWDEARIAINAYEMRDNGDYIVTYFDYCADMWNTKPPLLIWLQVFFMKTIGVNEIAVRLPSALAAFATCLTLLLFSLRYLKSFWPGCISILLLITSEGYISIHVSRTGDYDALLSLFTTLSSLLFFAFCETKKNNYLYFFFAALACAVLTKGIAGLLFTPALFLYGLFQKQLLSFLKNKHFYFGLSAFLFMAIGYYLLREARNPGYIATIQENELGGRFLNSQGNQPFDFWFYIKNLIHTRLSDRYLLIPCGLIFGLLSRNMWIRKLTFFLLLLIVSFLLIISSAKTKLEWYDAPLFPLLSLVIAIFIYGIFELLKTWSGQRPALRVLPFLFLGLIFLIPYQNTWNRTYLPIENLWDKEFYEISYYVRDATKGKHDLHGKYIVYEGYKAHLDFYVRKLHESGIKAGFKDPGQLNPGDVAIVKDEHIKHYIQEHFVYDITEKKGHVTTYRLKALKPLPVSN